MVEVGQIALHLAVVLRGDVGPAEDHQGFEVVAGVHQQAAQRGIGDFLLHQRDGAQMQAYQFLHEAEAFIQGQAEALEDAFGDARAHGVVSVEGPADARHEALGVRLGDVVHQRRPAQPQVLADGRRVVEHLQGVPEIVLVAVIIDFLHAVEVHDLGQDPVEQAALEQEREPDRGHRAGHDLVQLVHDALVRDDVQAVGHARDGGEGVGMDVEAKLGGEAHGTHHAERIVAEGEIRRQGRADDARLQVADAAERIQQDAVIGLVQRPAQRVDGEIAAVLVVRQAAILHQGFARLGAVAFLPCPDEFQLHGPPRHLRRPELLEHGHMRTAQLPGQGFGKGRTGTQGHEIHIGGLVRTQPVQVMVAHIAAHHIHRLPESGTDGRHAPEEVVMGGIEAGHGWDFSLIIG